MESESSRWKRFRRPGFNLEFSYPEVTPEGQAVERNEQPFRGRARVHLSSPDRRELYLEVVQFRDLTPEGEYSEHRPHLERRFGADSITALTETRLKDWRAWAYGFRWNEERRWVERSVLLIEVAGETYRIIFDPRSALTARVIATLSSTS